MADNIMLIDDSFFDRQIIKRLLEKRLKDISIYEMDNGLDVVNNLLKYNIQTCILDVLMPGKNGYKVLEELKAHPETKDIPVIICTVIDDIEGIEKALLLGALDYFSKPLSEETRKISLPLKVKNAIELMKRKQEISFLSFHDQLTGLYNRRFYEEELKRLDTERNLPFTLVMLDVNGLKLVNDAFGHLLGDKLLQRLARVMKNECRTDDIIARIGGDEFVIIFPKTTFQQAKTIVKRLSNSIAKEKVEYLDLSVSYGFATKVEAIEEMPVIFQKAEECMYKRKLSESIKMRCKTIKIITNTLYEKNPREEKHAKRVSQLSVALGAALNLSSEDISKLRMAGLMNNIGKITVNEKILNKISSLTECEWSEIKRHPETGYKILSSVNKFAPLAEDILSHHERWDGKGYPRGLKGEKISLRARIIAIADAYDAMISDRPYRKALSKEDALEEIKRNAGTQFDPHLVKVFIDEVYCKQCY